MIQLPCLYFMDPDSFQIPFDRQLFKNQFNVYHAGMFISPTRSLQHILGLVESYFITFGTLKYMRLFFYR